MRDITHTDLELLYPVSYTHLTLPTTPYVSGCDLPCNLGT